MCKILGLDDVPSSVKQLKIGQLTDDIINFTHVLSTMNYSIMPFLVLFTGLIIPKKLSLQKQWQ